METPATIKIDDVEYVRKDTQYAPRKEGPWIIGERYFIRTVTMHLHGRLVEVTDKELVLMEAAWIADSGRFWDFITGRAPPKEVEPFQADKPVIVGRGSLIDAQQLSAEFKVQK